VIEITDTAYGGSGVGRVSDGKAVFVPFTVTDDIVDIKILQDKSSYLLAELISIHKPSEWRVEPHCQYHGICGGCHFGHISYGKQLEVKKGHVENALRKYPHSLPEINVRYGAPLGYRIRATARVQNGRAGFLRNNSNDFIPVDDCLVIKPNLWAKIAEFAEKYRQDELITLSVIENPDGQAIALVGGDGNLPQIQDIKPFDGIKCGKILGVEHLEYKFGSIKIPVGYGGFFQANRYLMDEFHSYATGLAEGDILELYAGSGFFTSGLVSRGRMVQAFEANKSAVVLAKRYDLPVEALAAEDVFRRGMKFDTLFVDPPREGLSKKVLTDIFKHTPERVVYVSCNPMTLARDITRLAEKYKIAEITMFDMFPNTYHVETVVSLAKT
jgi:23S rRNA (uracil1939-C5)-methyltransferase